MLLHLTGHGAQTVGSPVDTGKLNFLSEPIHTHQLLLCLGTAVTVHRLEQLFAARAACIRHLVNRHFRLTVIVQVEHILGIAFVEHGHEILLLTVVIDDALAIGHQQFTVLITCNLLGIDLQ